MTAAAAAAVLLLRAARECKETSSYSLHTRNINKKRE